MKKFIMMAFALVLSAFVFGTVERVQASVATPSAIAAQSEVTKSEATSVGYYGRRRYRRYYYRPRYRYYRPRYRGYGRRCYYYRRGGYLWRRCYR